MSASAFWTLHAAICAGGGAAILLFGWAFRARLFRPEAPPS
jgi:hypothetical protein